MNSEASLGVVQNLKHLFVIGVVVSSEVSICVDINSEASLVQLGLGLNLTLKSLSTTTAYHHPSPQTFWRVL